MSWKEKTHQKRRSRFRFQSGMLEIIRKYAWMPEKRSLLYRYFELKPHHVVVDVGCGTGAFSRVLAQKIDPKRGGR